MSALAHYFVDARGRMREFREDRKPPDAQGTAELGWRVATMAEIENYLAGYAINAEKRFSITNSALLNGQF
jgi:hypothetical protein